MPDREGGLGDSVGPLGCGMLDATCLPLWDGSLLSTALPGTHAHKTGKGGCPWTWPVSSLLPNPCFFLSLPPARSYFSYWWFVLMGREAASGSRIRLLLEFPPVANSLCCVGGGG